MTKNTDFKKLTLDAIRAAGGEQAVADELGITRQGVNLWQNRNGCPAPHVLTLAKLSGKAPWEIRPDIFKTT